MKGQFRVHKDTQHPERPYRVEGNVDGKRRRAYFATLESAKEHARVENLQLQNLGHSAANIAPSLRIEALACLKALEPFGVSLSEAVKVYLSHYHARAKSISVEHAWRLYLEHTKTRVESNEIGERQLEGTIKTCERFASEFGAQQICDMTSERIKQWLTDLKKRDGQAMSIQSRNSFRLGLSGFFSYALEMKWISGAHPIKDNAVRAFRTRRDQARRPDILSVEQAARLLEVAPPEFLPAIAIGLFCGLRPTEVRRLSWENIHWEKREIDVLATSSKTASYRYVPMPDNLCEWLEPYRDRTGKLYECTAGTLARSLSAIGRASGLAVWPKDGLRHSYGSHLYAATENAHTTAKRMGHMTTEMLHSNYNNRRTKEQGEAYFGIRPGKAEKIVAIAA